jgi:hypothetical protein
MREFTVLIFLFLQLNHISARFAQKIIHTFAGHSNEHTRPQRANITHSARRGHTATLRKQLALPHIVRALARKNPESTLLRKRDFRLSSSQAQQSVQLCLLRAANTPFIQFPFEHEQALI